MKKIRYQVSGIRSQVFGRPVLDLEVSAAGAVVV